jgi:hypothetical protein
MAGHTSFTDFPNTNTFQATSSISPEQGTAWKGLIVFQENGHFRKLTVSILFPLMPLNSNNDNDNNNNNKHTRHLFQYLSMLNITDSSK